MPNGVVKIKKDLRYFRKAHSCPNCGNPLNAVSVSKVVNSRSPEAKDYDFHAAGMTLVGDVRFTWDEFECPSCKRHFSVEEIKKSEGIAVPAPKSKTQKWLWGAVVLLICLVLAALKYQHVI